MRISNVPTFRSENLVSRHRLRQPATLLADVVTGGELFGSVHFLYAKIE
jgi:hypothetical protein